VHFNDACCGSFAELRAIILKARRLADDDAERQRADAAVRTWLVGQIEQRRAPPTADIANVAPEPSAPGRLAA
jgi:hypothetical protein